MFLREYIESKSIVLDAGCGKNSVLPENVHGIAVDISCEGLRALNQNRVDLQCICASVEILPFKKGIFDVVVSRDILEHYNSHLAIQKISRNIKREGKFIASTSNLFSPIIMLDHFLGPIADTIAGRNGSQYFTRTKTSKPL